ncbi:MAG: hypothetical protein HUJ63_09410 [Enterococcus sp.]|nr:hypothetical protein [Enterococcus sp.]
MAKNPAKEYEELRAAIIDFGNYCIEHADDLTPPIDSEATTLYNSFSMLVTFDAAFNYNAEVTIKRSLIASERYHKKITEEREALNE